MPPSDAYVRSFPYLLYTLIKLYYTHTHKKFQEKIKTEQKMKCNKNAIKLDMQLKHYIFINFIMNF